MIGQTRIEPDQEMPCISNHNELESKSINEQHTLTFLSALLPWHGNREPDMSNLVSLDIFSIILPSLLDTTEVIKILNNHSRLYHLEKLVHDAD